MLATVVLIHKLSSLAFAHAGDPSLDGVDRTRFEARQSRAVGVQGREAGLRAGLVKLIFVVGRVRLAGGRARRSIQEKSGVAGSALAAVGASTEDAVAVAGLAVGRTLRIRVGRRRTLS